MTDRHVAKQPRRAVRIGHARVDASSVSTQLAAAAIRTLQALIVRGRRRRSVDRTSIHGQATEREHCPRKQAIQRDVAHEFTFVTTKPSERSTRFEPPATISSAKNLDLESVSYRDVFQSKRDQSGTYCRSFRENIRGRCTVSGTFASCHRIVRDTGTLPAATEFRNLSGCTGQMRASTCARLRWEQCTTLSCFSRKCLRGDDRASPFRLFCSL
jgi:hypothetical protein